MKNLNEMKVNTFSQVRKFLDAIPNINSGGCAASAYAMYLWVMAHYQNPAKDLSILYLDSGPFIFFTQSVSHAVNEQWISGDHSVEPQGCTHAVLEMNHKVYDSGSVHLKKWTDHFDESIVIKEPFIDEFMLKSFKDPNWVKDFDRKKWIPIIEKKLNINLHNLHTHGTDNQDNTSHR